MSRRHGADVQFGSDSFLDVVANIVGILIILMVIAGVRVSRTPVSSPAQIALPQAAVPDEPAPFEPETLLPPRPIQHDVPVAAPVPPAVALKPSDYLIGRIRELESKVASDAAQAAAAERESRDVAAAAQAHRARLGEEAEGSNGARAALEQERERLRAVEGSIAEFAVQLRNREAELERARKEQTPVATIRHRMTPLSQEVTGAELHFHLSGGRIAPIPLDELVERLKAQVRKQTDWLLKFPQHQGTVGPIGGFSMAYIAKRSELSLSEQLQAPVGLMRISVAQWTLEPQPNLPAETFQEALTPGSQFLRAVRMADAGATLTFWVYPDSFTLYRELADICRREGFLVAARPLPFGVPIAGSPDGTRSAGQ